MAKEIKVVVSNAFSGENNEAIKASFTKKWIEIINQSEKNKNNLIVQLDRDNSQPHFHAPQ